MNEFESVLYGTNFADPVNGYAKYIDVDSFIDMHIMQELSKNWDGYKYSSFFYKDRNGKLVAGPLWDMNITYGTAYYGWDPDWYHCSPEGWHYSQISSSDYNSQYYPRLFQDPEFAQKYTDRLNELLNTTFTEEKMMRDMAVLATYLDEAQQRHFARWDNLMGQYIWPEAWWGQTYEEELNIMRNWIHGRLMWIKSQFTTAPEPQPGRRPSRIGHDGRAIGAGGNDLLHHGRHRSAADGRRDIAQRHRLEHRGRRHAVHRQRSDVDVSGHGGRSRARRGASWTSIEARGAAAPRNSATATATRPP